MTTYQLRQDSGGPGQNEVEQALFAAMKYGAMQLGFTFGLSALSRRLGVSSAGRRGAKPSVTIQSLTGESVELLKVNAKQLQYGTVVTGYTGGGGGFGHPFDRDLAEVLADVMNEYVSVTAAKRDYGVVIHQGTMELDVANLVGDIARLRLRSTAGSRSFRVVVVRVKIVFSYIEIIYYVLEGRILLQVDDKDYVLGVGDALHFPSSIQHSMENLLDITSRVLCVLQPAIFQ